MGDQLQPQEQQPAKKNSAGVILLLILIIAGVVWYCNTPEPPGTNPPTETPTSSPIDLSRTVFANVTGSDLQKPVNFKVIINTDKTGSLSSDYQDNNSSWVGNWEIQSSNSEMTKIVLHANGGDCLISLYKNKEATVNIPNHQMNGTWYQ
jgi:hypothetical protein